MGAPRGAACTDEHALAGRTPDPAGRAQPLELSLHERYDHSYYFVATFMEDHLRHHAAHLGA